MPVFDRKEEEPEVAVQVDDETQLDFPEVQQEPEQVKSDIVTFVAQEDFEGRINQEDFRFQNGVRYSITRDQANTWVQAGKGYVIEE